LPPRAVSSQYHMKTHPRFRSRNRNVLLSLGAYDLSTTNTSPTMPVFTSPTPTFSCQILSHIFDNDNHANRSSFRAALAADKSLFVPRNNIKLEEERELALERLKWYCGVHKRKERIISVRDFERNPENVMTGTSATVPVDEALAYISAL
jgi:hypothetical protein